MKIRFVNYRKEFPNMGKNGFATWFYVRRYWSGKIIDIGIRHFALSFDFRKDFISDMTNGEVKMKDYL